jgi:hypothetical protein
MRQQLGHPLQQRTVNRPLTKIVDPGYSTHLTRIRSFLTEKFGGAK